MSLLSVKCITAAEIASPEEPQSPEEGRELGPEVGGDQEAGDGGEAPAEQALGEGWQTEQLLLGEQGQVGGVCPSQDPATQEEAGDSHLSLAMQVRPLTPPQLHSLQHLQEGRHPPAGPDPGHQRQEHLVIGKD